MSQDLSQRLHIDDEVDIDSQPTSVGARKH